MNQNQLNDCRLIVNQIQSFLPKNTELVGAELGVKEGYLSRTFLECNPKLTLYSIDLWGEHASIDELHDHEHNYRLALDQLTPFKERSIIKRMLTMEAVSDFADESLDFIFIDATHTYEAVKQEILYWSSKVKADGWIFGHDYTPFWHGVMKAVDESIINTSKLNLLAHTCWAVNNQFIKK